MHFFKDIYTVGPETYPSMAESQSQATTNRAEPKPSHHPPAPGYKPPTHIQISPPIIPNPFPPNHPPLQGVMAIPDSRGWPADLRAWSSMRWINESRWPAAYVRALKPQILPLAYTAGVPLMYVRWPGPETAESAFMPNFFVCMLTANYDVARIEAEIGNGDGKGRVAVIGSNDATGACFMFREDGLPLRIQHVEALNGYFTQCLQDVGFCDQFEIATVEELRRRIALLRHRLSPERFRVFWGDLQRMRILQGDRSWITVEQPVSGGVAERYTSVPGRRRFD